MKTKLDRYLIAAGFVGPILFFLTIYFLFALMVPGYDVVNKYISELGAVDSPVKIMANVFGFSLFGVLLMIFSYGLYRSEELKWGKLISLFFFVTGILMFLVGIFYCDAGCSNYSTIGYLHEVVSNYQFPILALGLIILAFDVVSHNKLRWLTPVIFVFGVITLILAYISLIKVPPPTYPGIVQRLAIGLPYLLVMIISISLYKIKK